MLKTIHRNPNSCEELLGKFVDESHFDLLVEENTDCYLSPEKTEDSIAFKFRKNFFSKEEQEQAYLGLREAAVPSQNRGLAAGPRNEKLGGRDWVTVEQLEILKFLSKDNYSVDISDILRIKAINKTKIENRGLVWLTSEIQKHNFNFESWLKQVISKNTIEIKKEASWVLDTFVSDTTYANSVNSGIAGWFDRYPRIPYGRATSYTQNNFDKFKMSFPFLQNLDKGFKELLPERWSKQRKASNKMDKRFLVPGTSFSTITVNKTFRTACHRDAGDFTAGMSNLLVLSNDGRYTGGYLVLPEIKIAINVRPGDLLLINNHECIHGNTPIICEEGSERISLVCYLREKMLELGSYEYENLRFEYVESRRKNKEHPKWEFRWNGISEGMWEEDEWFEYLKTNGGEAMLNEYHPKNSSLEALFG
jgi:hypothetical protein